VSVHLWEGMPTAVSVAVMLFDLQWTSVEWHPLAWSGWLLRSNRTGAQHFFGHEGCSCRRHLGGFPKHQEESGVHLAGFQMQGALQWSGKQNGFCLECHLVRASPAYHGLDPPSSKIVLKRGTVPAGNWSFDRGQAGTVYTTEHVPVHFIAKKKGVRCSPVY
jgi:hypothetical protein